MGGRHAGQRFGDPRVEALAGALANLLSAITDITNKSLRALMTGLLATPYSLTEVISIDAMASVDTVVWSCRVCDQRGTATTWPPRTLLVSIIDRRTPRHDGHAIEPRVPSRPGAELLSSPPERR